MTTDNLGPFGLVSAVGAVVLGLLALGRKRGVAAWPLSSKTTGKLAVLAGLGTALLWTGNDPTNDEPQATA